jgi:hypothetical protein
MKHMAQIAAGRSAARRAGARRPRRPHSLALPALALAAAVAWFIGGGPASVYGQATATPTPTPVQRAGGRFEDNDPALLYSGAWTAVSEARASAGSLRRSNAAGAFVQLTFPGPNIRWVTTRGPDRGIARVFIDDQDRGTVDLYAPSEQFQQELSWGGLAGDQDHTIRVEVTGQRTGASTGTNVDVDAFIAAGAVAPEPIRFEDTDPAVTYSGTWSAVNETRASGGTVHRASAAGSAAQFTFTGGSITWLTSTGPNRGIARVLVDGALKSTADLFNPEERLQQAFRFEGLGDGTHTIRIEVTGTHSGPSTDNVVDVDAFIVFGAPTTPVPTPTAAATATPTATAAPAATATPTPAPTPAPPPAPRDARFFFETSYRVDHDPFWSYFTARGGVDTFGFPVSRTFPFLGCTTQFFQRQLLQQCGAGAPVQTMNLLDPDLMPFNQINFSTFPAHDPAVAGAAPPPGTPNYGVAVLEHVRRVAPDSVEGLPVRFFATFVTTVPGVDPGADPDLAALLNLEIWGFPTSQPAFDPANRRFVYQRFQRGIMHFDASTGVTRGILLSDYFKGIILGEPGPTLPPDLLAQAVTSRFFRQYCPGQPNWVCRPSELPGTDLTFAFERQ